MRRLLLFALLACAPALADGPERYVAVVPPKLRQAIEPLLAHRRAEGLDVRVVDASQGFGVVRRAVTDLDPRYLLLVGDVDLVPAFEAAEATTDRPWGDHDGDGLPEAAVGRIPSSDPAAVARVVARTIAYEAARSEGRWRKQCALVAGEGRFGALADAMIETMVQRILTNKVPLAYDVDLTYANPRSPYCWPPERFAARVVDRAREGALVMAYVGHGDQRSVDELRVKGPDGRVERYEVLDAGRASAIETDGPPIMIAIACWTGRYEAPEPCIGEELLLTGKGPVAFLGATRISHPIPNALLAIALVGELFGDGPDRLGPALDRARASLVKDTGDPIRREILQLSLAIMPPSELKYELPRHVDMYNLLGDPALRLARPSREGALEARVDGQRLVVRGKVAPGPRSVTVTLEVPRDQVARPAAPGETPAERCVRTNDKVLRAAVARVAADGTFAVDLPRPTGAGGRHVVKAFATDGGCASLATTLDLPAPAGAPPAAPAAPTPAKGRGF